MSIRITIINHNSIPVLLPVCLKKIKYTKYVNSSFSHLGHRGGRTTPLSSKVSVAKRRASAPGMSHLTGLEIKTQCTVSQDPANNQLQTGQGSHHNYQQKDLRWVALHILFIIEYISIFVFF